MPLRYGLALCEPKTADVDRIVVLKGG